MTKFMKKYTKYQNLLSKKKVAGPGAGEPAPDLGAGPDQKIPNKNEKQKKIGRPGWAGPGRLGRVCSWDLARWTPVLEMR